MIRQSKKNAGTTEVHSKIGNGVDGDWFSENMRRMKEGEKRRKSICLRGALRESGPGL